MAGLGVIFWLSAFSFAQLDSKICLGYWQVGGHQQDSLGFAVGLGGQWRTNCAFNKVGALKRCKGRSLVRARRAVSRTNRAQKVAVNERRDSVRRQGAKQRSKYGSHFGRVLVSAGALIP